MLMRLSPSDGGGIRFGFTCGVSGMSLSTTTLRKPWLRR